VAGRARKSSTGNVAAGSVGALDTQDVKVPTEAERKRVRNILDELRRRAGEPARPTLELDYIDRLLRRF
jgi:hypothetical protein